MLAPMPCFSMRPMSSDSVRCPGGAVFPAWRSTLSSDRLSPSWSGGSGSFAAACVPE